MVTNKMEVNFNMLCSFVKHIIVYYLYWTLVVTIDMVSSNVQLMSVIRNQSQTISAKVLA